MIGKDSSRTSRTSASRSLHGGYQITFINDLAGTPQPVLTTNVVVSETTQGSNR